MNVESVIYANMRASVHENALLSAEQYVRLSECKNSEEVVRYLSTLGYEGATADEMFRNAMDSVYAFLDECAPIPALCVAMKKKNDYHNAKVMIKCKYMRKAVPEELLYLNGNLDVVKMKDGILADNYADLPQPMAKALEEIDLRFYGGERSARLIDCLLTKATYEDMLAVSAKFPAFRKLVVAEIDAANLSAAMRIRANGLAEKELATERIEGGSVPYAVLADMLTADEETVISRLAPFGYAEAAKTAFSDLAQSRALRSFEKLADNVILSEVKKSRANYEDYMYFYGFVYARLYELKNVRLIAGGVNAGWDRQTMQERLRTLYVG